MKEIYENCNILYNYLFDKDKINKCDVLIVCGSSDLSVVEAADKINMKCFPECFIFTGKEGKGTKGKYKNSEAERMASYAESFGIFNSKMLIEDKSINTLQNINYSNKLIKKYKDYINTNNIAIIHKPYVLKRIKLICKRKKLNYKVTSINTNFTNYLIKVITNGYMSENDVICEMVAEIFYIKHHHIFRLAKEPIPKEVLDAYNYLKKKGYNKYII